jgi:hypothetical protein
VEARDGNMLREGTLDALRLLGRPVRVVVRLPLGRAHREQLARVPGLRVTAAVGTGPLDAAAVAQLEALGPVPVTVELSGRLDARRAGALARLKSGVLFFAPDHPRLAPDEVERLRWLPRLARFLVVPAKANPDDLTDDAERIPGLGFSIETDGNRLPDALVARLQKLDRPLRVELDAALSPADAKRLEALPRFSLRVRATGRPEGAPAPLLELLAKLGPPR